MPQMSSTYAPFCAAQDLIYAMQNPTPEIPLFKLVNGHKKTLRNLAEMFRKANPPEVTLRVPVRGSFKDKLQQVNQ